MTAKTLTEEEVEAFLSDLRAGDADKKVNLITHWGLKLDGVTDLPERGVDAITMLVGPFVRSPAHLLVTSTLNSFLPTFLPLIPTAPASHVKLALSCMLPGLIEKLNDPKERLSTPARECLGLLGAKVYGSESLAASQGPSRVKDKDGVVSQWETGVKDALSGRAARAKIEILKLLLAMRDDPAVKLPLKPWLASLVNVLEDSDGAVRDQARETVVALLSPPSTPPAARTEFKKLMLARNVRKSIADGILARVLGGASVPSTPAAARQAPTGSSESTRAPTPANEDVEVVYIAGARDLDLEFKAMIPHFAVGVPHGW
jgi:CLIP-associating protein 1/2